MTTDNKMPQGDPIETPDGVPESYWNYRWFKMADGTVSCHETYYENGVPNSRTKEPVKLYGYEDSKALASELQGVLAALDEPLLDDGSYETLKFYRALEPIAPPAPDGAHGCHECSCGDDTEECCGGC